MAKTNKKVDNKNQQNKKGSRKKDLKYSNGNRGNNRSKEETSKGPRLNRDANLRAVEKNDPRNYVNRVMNSTNDFGWYNKVPGIIGDATKISWFNQLGAQVTPFGDGLKAFRVPGVMVFDAVTCPGLSVDSTSGASLAGNQLFDAIRRALNKPNPDYEGQDALMVMLACDDLYCQYVNLLRAFGILHTFSGDNLYTPTALLKAFYGFSPVEYKDFVENEANYRAQFNQLIYKASSFIFYPKDFAITDRHAWLFGNLFKDHDDTEKYQIYGFRKYNDWFFSETISTEGTALEYKKIQYRTNTVADMLSRFNKSIEALRNSTLVRTLFADMRQAFGDTTTLQMARVDELFTIVPGYDTHALMQIENMDVNFGWTQIESDFLETCSVYQDVNKNTLVWAPFLQAGTDPAFEAYSTLDRILNTHTQDESDEIVAEATRLMTPWIPYEYNGDSGYTINASADFVVGVEFINNPDIPDLHTLRTFVRNTASGDVLRNWVWNDLLNWCAFDWAPKIMLSKEDENHHFTFQPVLEYDHYTVIGANDYNSVLSRLNTACNISMWSIPEWGSWKT